MTLNIAISGLGRIGRCATRAFFEQKKEGVCLKAIHARIHKDESLEAYYNRMLHTLKYDSAHGIFAHNMSIENDHLIVDDHPPIALVSTGSPEQCPWQELGIDVLFECTGQFKSKEKASLHLKSGAKQVLISAPGGEGIERTVVYGVNHHTLRGNDVLISNASCTTNCLAPVLHVIQTLTNIENGFVTTVHAATNDQRITDASHNDLRRARASLVSMIPTKTGAAKTIGKIIPELDGKLDGGAIRVPTLNVSLIDVTLQTNKALDATTLNEAFIKASKHDLKGVLDTHTAPLVSIDFNHHSASAVVDLSQTKVQGQLVKVAAWYDNEWAFACRMIDTACAMVQART